MSFRYHGAPRAALSLALFAALALPQLALPGTAFAQDGARVPEPLTPIKTAEAAAPTWALNLLNAHVGIQQDRATVVARLRGDGGFDIDYKAPDGRQFFGTAVVSNDRLHLEGTLPATGGGANGRRIRIHQVYATGGFVLSELDDLGRIVDSFAVSLLANAPEYAAAGTATSSMFGAWLGEWKIGNDVLTVSSQGRLLTGTLHDASRSTMRARIVFLNAPNAPTQLYGVWQSPGIERYEGGTLAISLQGAKAFAGSRYDALGRETPLSGSRGGQGESAPAPRPTPQPAPRPAPPPPAAEPDLLPAGVFHALESFDVRLDEARAGRDGRLHVFVTVRNRSGRSFYMSSGPLRVVATDADGVGVEAETRPYRATGEEAKAFDEIPTIPAGGEFRMRYAIDLPDVHGPLRRVSFRESAKKALVFDVAHADPGASPASAPAVGRGAFKPLSKFDLRIDNVVAARDGRIEAFVTLRNTTRDVQSTSKGDLRLESANADGAKVTSVSALYSVRGERGRYDELPLLVYVEPGGEIRLRYVFDEAISGAITVTDGRVRQVFTPGG